MRKGLLLFCVLIATLCFSVNSFAIKMHKAKIKEAKVYHSPHYTNGQKEVTVWEHPVYPGEVQIMELEGVSFYAVDPDHPGLDWLNRSVAGNLFMEAVPVHSTHTGEHLGLFALYPGTYDLLYTDIEEVKNEEGYQHLKKIMGDHLTLIEPIAPGYYVGIRIRMTENNVNEKK